MCQLGLRSSQRINVAVLQRAATVIDQPVALERTVVELVQLLDEQHQLLRGVPAVHQHAIEVQAFVGQQAQQHVLDVIGLGLAIAIRVIEPVVRNPVLPGVRIDIQAVDHPDALDQAMRIAVVLAADHLDAV